LTELRGLYKKELLLSRSTFFSGLLFLFSIFVVGLILSSDNSYLEVFTIMALFMHIFYLPLIVLVSLNVEAKTQLWLHNPNSGAKLFLAKLLGGFTYFLVSLALTSIIAWLVLLNSSDLELVNDFQGIRDILLINLSVTIGTVYLSVWALFYWSLYHSMKKVPFLKNIRWFIIIGLPILLSALKQFIQSQPFYKRLAEMNAINLDLANGFQSTNLMIQSSSISLFTVVLYFIISITVFLFAVWLLERKVEV